MTNDRELSFTPDDPLSLPEAAAMGRLDVIKYQSEQLPFDANQRNSEGYTALMVANTPQAAELLLTVGADPKAKFGDETVLDVHSRLSAQYALAARNSTDPKQIKRNEIAATAHRAVHHRIETYVTYMCCHQSPTGPQS